MTKSTITNGMVETVELVSIEILAKKCSITVLAQTPEERMAWEWRVAART
jgi:hypothetical protein